MERDSPLPVCLSSMSFAVFWIVDLDFTISKLIGIISNCEFICIYFFLSWQYFKLNAAFYFADKTCPLNFQSLLEKCVLMVMCHYTFEDFWLLLSGGTSQHSRNSIFMIVSINILQDSILYFYIEDGTGVLLHWICSLWTKMIWKERRTFPWKSFALSTMDVNR